MTTVRIMTSRSLPLADHERVDHANLAGSLTHHHGIEVAGVDRSVEIGRRAPREQRPGERAGRGRSSGSSSDSPSTIVPTAFRGSSGQRSRPKRAPNRCARSASSSTIVPPVPTAISAPNGGEAVKPAMASTQSWSSSWSSKPSIVACGSRDVTSAPMEAIAATSASSSSTPRERYRRRRSDARRPSRPASPPSEIRRRRRAPTRPVRSRPRSIGLEGCRRDPAIRRMFRRSADRCLGRSSGASPPPRAGDSGRRSCALPPTHRRVRVVPSRDCRERRCPRGDLERSARRGTRTYP